MLTRVYGVTFPKKSLLDEYILMMEEAKKRDHRKIGKEMELFTFSQRVGQGLPLWLPKGAALRERLENFLKKLQKSYGYLPVVTPHIGNKDLYVTSGHYAKYGKDSFQPIHTPQEGEEYLLKPMNCPHHCEIYRAKPRSYKDLPLRLAEFGTVYRYEQSGELHGLTRVRSFTQDDAHLFVRPDQIKEEFCKVIDIILYVFKTLDFKDYVAQVSLRDPNNKSKYIGSDENWAKAEAAIIEAAEEKGLNTVVEYGEAAFYGPKLDFMVKDAIGRKWQLGTIQVDYNLPERFELEYIGNDNQKVNNTLRMNNNFYFILRNIKKIRGLYNFQPFVHHCGRVDSNFCPHVPRRVFECIFCFCSFQLFIRKLSESTTTGSENKSFNMLFFVALKTLPYCTVLTVNRINFTLIFIKIFFYNFATANKCFFVCKRNNFALF